MSEVLALALEMIDIQSISGAEGPMADFLEGWLKPRGWQVQRQTVAPGRDNLYAHRPGKTPELVFNSHIDTVPPFFPASQDQEWIYGRGACDTKSLIAAQLLAVSSLPEAVQDRIGFLYVVGEEVDHCGMAAANDLGLNPRYLIVGEPTESKLGRRQKGVLKVRLEGHGKAAHSGYPHTGVSAIDPLLDVLQDLRHAQWPKDEMLGETTLNIGILNGGRAANVVPDQAFAELMFRIVTSQAEIHRKVKEIVADRVSCNLITANDPCDLTTLEGYQSVVVAFNTDIPYFKFDGKALLWGAGSILDAHTSGERIGKKDLVQAVEVYADLARRCLNC